MQPEAQDDDFAEDFGGDFGEDAMVAQVDVAAAAPAGFDDVFTDTETAQSKVDRPSDSKHESKPLLLC